MANPSIRRRRPSTAATAGGNGEDRRLMQNRLAQRAYRERKDNRIKELEAQIAELEREITQARSLAESSGEGSSPASSGSSQSSGQTVRSPSTQSNTFQPHAPINHDKHHHQSCDSCDMEKFNSALMVAQLADLESKLSLMHTQNQSLKTFISTQEEQMKTLLGYSDPLMLQDSSSILHNTSSTLHDSSSLLTMTMPSFDNHQMHSSQLAGPTNRMPIHMSAIDTTQQSNILTQYYSPFQISNSGFNHYMTSGPSLNLLTLYENADWNSVIEQTAQPPIEVERDVTEELVSKFGVLDVEWGRQALKGLDSLVNNSDVDEMIDAFAMQTETKDPTVLQLCLIRCSKMKGRMLDACTQNDKLRAIEIMGRMRSKNQNYVDRLFAEVIETAASQKKASSSERSHASSSSTSSHVPRRSSKPETTPAPQNTSGQSIPDRAPEYTIFRQACLFVPALTGHGHLVDELIELFTMQLKLQDPIEKKEAFFRMVKVRTEMESLCQTDEDRNKLVLALELGRDRNRPHVEDMLCQVEEATASLQI
ncbi:hypothetical protein BJ741DRAFT_598458, partial [Chytriomyces cf. hyalinus JEL632]